MSVLIWTAISFASEPYSSIFVLCTFNTDCIMSSSNVCNSSSNDFLRVPNFTIIPPSLWEFLAFLTSSDSCLISVNPWNEPRYAAYKMISQVVVWIKMILSKLTIEWIKTDFSLTFTIEWIKKTNLTLRPNELEMNYSIENSTNSNAELIRPITSCNVIPRVGFRG